MSTPLLEVTIINYMTSSTKTGYRLRSLLVRGLRIFNKREDVVKRRKLFKFSTKSRDSRVILVDPSKYFKVTVPVWEVARDRLSFHVISTVSNIYTHVHTSVLPHVFFKINPRLLLRFDTKLLRVVRRHILPKPVSDLLSFYWSMNMSSDLFSILSLLESTIVIVIVPPSSFLSTLRISLSRCSKPLTNLHLRCPLFLRSRSC